MKFLPSLFKKKEVLVAKENEVAVAQTQALDKLASSVCSIAEFLNNGGLQKTLGEYAKAQIAKDIMGGLAAHDGRNALDARFIKQNAVEIIHTIEAVFDKAKERADEKRRGVERDREVHDAESEFKKWDEKK